MKEAEFIGEIDRYGSVYQVYLDPAENCIRITDERGNELRCGTKKTKDHESVMKRVPKILQSVGL